MKVYNTLGRELQELEPRDAGKIGMYVCGATVQSDPHLGHGRSAVVFDVIRRYLEWTGYEVTYVRNVTDVDDKINAAAAKEGVEIGVLTARYLAAYHEDMATLGVLPPDVEPKVTDNLGPIIAMIEKLVASGHAYEADGHVLFAVGSFTDYGRLSGRDRDELIAGARVEVAPYKREPADFVLWKPSPEDIVGWDSPWGRGRPGWHIECSAMAETHLGATIDIHGGGQDLVFPHHENEVAQSTCAHAGRAYARYWIHNGLIHVDSEKMSKSIGNVLLVRDLLAEAPGEVVRLGLLTAHYRQPLDWTGDVLTEAEQKLDRMYGALREAGLEGPAVDDGIEPPASVVEALEDDLNSPRALAELFSLARDANRADDPEERLAKARQLRAGAGLLGLLRDDPEAWFMRSSASAGGPGGGLSDAEIDALMAEREALRQARKFAEADVIRDKLASQNVVIEDSAGGPRWRRSR